METLKTKTTLSASELRIGNWIYNEDTKMEYQVDAHGILVVSRSPENRSPIPLSPDILLSTGFKYLKVEGVSSFEEFHNPDEDTHCWSFNVKSTDLIDSHEICLVKWGEEEYFTFQLGRGTYRKKIKYLHELQNGMFFLTGEELTINLLKT